MAEGREKHTRNDVILDSSYTDNPILRPYRLPLPRFEIDRGVVL